MADHSVSAQDKFHESMASWTLVFCIDNASPEKSCFVFLNGIRKGAKSSTGEKGFFQFTSEGKTDKGKEFTIAKGTVKVCLLHFRLEDLTGHANHVGRPPETR